MALPKYTNQRPQTLQVGGKAISVDSHTMVVPSLLSVHTHPKYWTPLPLVWRPSRWISSSGKTRSNCNLAAQLQHEELFVPAKGTYFPWSDGAQNCPGKKYSQVEFVAVIASLLREHRTRLVRPEGEDVAAARKRILEICEDSEQILLLQMRNAGSVRLTWTRV